MSIKTADERAAAHFYYLPRHLMLLLLLHRSTAVTYPLLRRIDAALSRVFSGDKGFRLTADERGQRH